MTSPFTLLIIVAVHWANANYCEGDYTTDKYEIIREIDADKSVHEGRVSNNIFLHRTPFKDICNNCNENEKLSICMKVLQHKWKLREPSSFTVDPTESNYECQPTKFTARNSVTFYQRMYLCPTTTVLVLRTGTSHIEKPFFIGQGLHVTQYRIRFFERSSTEDPAVIRGQLTGFKLNEMSFHVNPEWHVEYWPHYDEIAPARDVLNFRDDGNMDDYLVQWEYEPEE